MAAPLNRRRLSEEEYEEIKVKLYRDLQSDLAMWALKRAGGILLLLGAAFLKHGVDMVMRG